MSSSNALTYSGIQQRYDENHTHLHIWLAANSHASYNRYSLVFKSIFKVLQGLDETEYIDRVDYSSSGYDLYFPYDQLINLGEVRKETMTQCPDSHYWLEFHCYPRSTGSKHWLAYRGKLGHFSHTPPPFMPAKEASNPSHEWMEFTDSPNFGNSEKWEWVYSMEIYWVIYMVEKETKFFYYPRCK